MPQDQRAEDRFSLFVIASLYWPRGGGMVKVRNISRNGALIEGDAIPPPGTMVELRRGTLAVAGEIVWHRAGKAGVHLSAATDVTLWLPTATNQRQVDQAVQTIKAAGPGPAKGAPPHASFVSSQDMINTAALLDDLADALSSDAGVLFNYATKLQALDIGAQLLRKLAVQVERRGPIG